MSSLFAPVPPPKTALGYHRILSPKAGVRVSPLCLGAMSLGSAWGSAVGQPVTKEDAFALLDAFYQAGGNFIDTANAYQNEESEEWVGEWMEKRGVRDEMVIATKYTTNYVSYKMKESGKGIASNYGGNSSKSLHLSLRDSLKKLRTTYIDILYVHWWDYSSSIEEVMRSLDDVIKARQVLYIGASDIPAWIVSKANQYARDHALSQFVIYQGLWNVMLRDFEREIIPMCIEEGMAIAPWGAIGRGKFQSKAQVEERKKNNDPLRRGLVGGSEQTPQEVKMSEALEKVGKEVGGMSVAAVALAYVLQRCPYVFPIVGGRKVSQLEDNIRGLEITLNQEQIDFLESQAEFASGFPHDFLGTDPRRFGETTSFMIKISSNIKWVKHSPAIGGAKVPNN